MRGEYDHVFELGHRATSRIAQSLRDAVLGESREVMPRRMVFKFSARKRRHLPKRASATEGHHEDHAGEVG